MRISVKTLQGPDCFPVVSENTSVLELKYLVTTEMDIPVERQRLVFKGKALQDNMTLQQCGVTQGSKILLSVKEVGSVERPLVSTSSATTTSNSSSVATPSDRVTSRSEFHVLLCSLLSKHFSSTDVERVAAEFKRELNDQVMRLSLDDIERIATSNLSRN